METDNQTPGAEPDTKLKMVTVAEIKVFDKTGAVIEHFRINPDGETEYIKRKGDPGE